MHKINELHGKGDAGFFLNFPDKQAESSVQVRTGVSLVDMAGARNNLQKELAIPYDWDWDQVVKHVREIWNEYLSRIEIETDDYLQQKKFYSNLYRAIAARPLGVTGMAAIATSASKSVSLSRQTWHYALRCLSWRRGFGTDEQLVCDECHRFIPDRGWLFTQAIL